MSRGAVLSRAVLSLAAGLGACRSIPVTPVAIETCSAAPEEKERALRRWREAVDLANEFLASPFRRTLPAARYDLGPDGMRFVAGDRAWPIEVRSTTWGDLVLWAGFQAQEREYGFCVGECLPEEEPLLDHSFFRTSDGGLLEPDSIADLILHETAHVVAREGTIGFWNSLAFYAEAVFLFRSTTHSDEDIPHAVSEEFAFFRTGPGGSAERRDAALSMLEGHLGTGGPHCRHGPIEGAPAPARSIPPDGASPKGPTQSRTRSRNRRSRPIIQSPCALSLRPTTSKANRRIPASSWRSPKEASATSTFVA